jgi:hypothetical protein
MYVYVALQMHMFPIFDHNFDLKSPENDSDDIARLPIVDCRYIYPCLGRSADHREPFQLGF